MAISHISSTGNIPSQLQFLENLWEWTKYLSFVLSPYLFINQDFFFLSEVEWQYHTRQCRSKTTSDHSQSSLSGIGTTEQVGNANGKLHILSACACRVVRLKIKSYLYPLYFQLLEIALFVCREWEILEHSVLKWNISRSLTLRTLRELYRENTERL